MCGIQRTSSSLSPFVTFAVGIQNMGSRKDISSGRSSDNVHLEFLLGSVHRKSQIRRGSVTSDVELKGAELI